jgi:hypothetical protein
MEETTTAAVPRCVQRTGKECRDCVECLSKHPEGKTCRDCYLFARCQAFLGISGAETYCDWYPSAFHALARRQNEPA